MKHLFKSFQILILVLTWMVAGAQDVSVPDDLSDTPGTTVFPVPEFDTPLGVLYNNGALFNSPGTGPGGTNQSFIDQGGVNFGYFLNHANNVAFADDFTVPTGVSWNISSFDFFAYQINSTLTSTFTHVYVRVWNGIPGGGGSIIWGDFTTNLISGSSFSNVYRVAPPAPSVNTQRPIMKIMANTPGLLLPAGTYWVEWTLTGSLPSIPFQPPICSNNTVSSGNALRLFNGVYSSIQDPPDSGYIRGVPFTVNGDVIAPAVPAMSTWGLILLGVVLVGVGVYFVRLRI